MKFLWALFGFALLGDISGLSEAYAQPEGTTRRTERVAASDNRKNTRPEPFAVVEIFLTESSLLSKVPAEVAFRLERRSQVADDNLFTLVYHVDYLNDRGWRDPYSKPEFTKRQQMYSRSFDHPRSEPAMAVINGIYYSPANRFEHVVANIKEAQRKRPRVRLDVDREYSKDGKAVILRYDVKGIEKLRRTFLNFTAALIEDELLSTVQDGPNAGYTFRHTNLVHHLDARRVGKEGQGSLELVLPEQTDSDAMSVIYFLQDPQRHEISAAGRFSLKSLKSR